MQIKDLGNGIKAIVTVPDWADRFADGKQFIQSAERYKQSPTAFTCVQMRAQTISSIPFGLFIDGDLERPVSDLHPAFELLSKVNPEMNWIDLIRATESDMLIYGHAFWLKLGATPEKPQFIVRLNPRYIKVEVRDGEIVFVRTDIKKTEIYTKEQVVYFRDYSPDIEPVSPLKVCQQAIEVEVRSAQYMNVFFTNSAVPPVILTTEQHVVDADHNRIRRWWNKTFRGVENQHKVAIIDKGLTPTILGYPVKDLAMTEVRAEARRDICAALRVPPALAGAWEAANYATATEQKESFYSETILPRAEYYADVINTEIVSLYDPNIEFVWMVMDLPIMQDDKYMEGQRVSGLVQAGVLNPLAGALDLGYEESEAGYGSLSAHQSPEEEEKKRQSNPFTQPPQNNRNNDDGDEKKMTIALNKWERKSLNSMSRDKGPQVEFESEYIPLFVNELIYTQLGRLKTKNEVRDLFEQFKA